MNNSHENMTISSLSKLSEIPVSTIKFYLRKKMLPKPVKTGATRAYYTLKHFDRLKLIKKIQEEGKMPLDKIREVTALIDAENRREQQSHTQDVPSTRSEITQTAINLFRKKGYESVTIADIVASAQIGFSTFYRNFSNKKELFISCIHEIISSDNSLEDPEEISDETDLFQFFDSYAKISTKAGIVFRDMMDQLRAAAISDPAEFADKMEEVVQSKLQAFEGRVEKSINKGFIRKLDKTVLAVMLYGIEEAAYQYSIKRKFDEPELDALGEAIMDILLHGILKT